MKNQSFFKTSVYLTTFLRLVIPFFIWRFPIFTAAASELLDAIDGDLFQRAQTSKKTYQKIDKLLDLYWYFFILAFLFRTPLSYVFLILFLHRAIAQVIFFIKKDRKIFFYFPNLFGHFFIFYLLVNKIPQLAFLSKGASLYFSILVLVFLKLIQEYILHIKEIDTSDFLTGKKTLWRE